MTYASTRGGALRPGPAILYYDFCQVFFHFDKLGNPGNPFPADSFASIAALAALAAKSG